VEAGEAMTQEFIEKLRAAQQKREDFKKEQEEALKAWDAENLDPLVKSCDHTYPWGESAMRPDYSQTESTCQICLYYLWRN
jgi:hypothetical protein